MNTNLSHLNIVTPANCKERNHLHAIGSACECPNWTFLRNAEPDSQPPVSLILDKFRGLYSGFIGQLKAKRHYKRTSRARQHPFSVC